jgi:hypothetical protein
MLRLGILLTVLGFGSLLMELTDRQFVLLMWAEDYQPAIGIIVGIVGLALIGVNVVRGRKTSAPAPQAPAPQNPQG